MKMINKLVYTIESALEGLRDGATVMISGFGDAGSPFELVHGVLDTGVRDLTIISNNAGTHQRGIALLMQEKRIKRILCSYPRSSGAVVMEEMYKKGEIELELIPQGTLVEKIRCGGSGIPAFYTKTGVGTPLGEGKEVKTIRGEQYLMEESVTADFSLIKGKMADRWGNIVYDKTGRNFGPVMAMAGRVTVVQVEQVVELGGIDPEHVVTPGIFVNRVIQIRGKI